MNIECSHCGAVNPADSTFCGECGWQVLPPEVEVEIEEFITTVLRKADRDAVRTGPAAKPAPDQAQLEPEPVAISPEPEAGQTDLQAQPEEEPTGSEIQLEPAPDAISPEPEAGRTDLQALLEEEPSGGEPEPEPEQDAISPEPQAGQADLEIVPVQEPAAGQADLEPGLLVDGPGGESGPDAVTEATRGEIPFQGRVFFEDGEGVTITSSAAVFGDRIYARSDILSVAVETGRATRWPSLLLAAFGAVILALAVASLGRDPRLGFILVAGGLALLSIGAILAFTAHDQYLVCVRTASGVEAALVSTDRERVQRIVQAMRGDPRGTDLIQQD